MPCAFVVFFGAVAGIEPKVRRESGSYRVAVLFGISETLHSNVDQRSVICSYDHGRVPL